MAFIQGTITDLDDLLIQISSISASNGNITVVTSAAHGVTTGTNRKVVISNTTNFDGEYFINSVSDATTFVLTSTGITATESSGQAMVNDVEQNNVYYTPEITLNIVAKTFTLNSAGNLLTDGTGVTGQALYSFFKERWKEVPSITKYVFPMLSITNEQFEFINGWTPATDATRKKIRTAGWAETIGTLVKRRYSGIVSLGSLENTAEPYYVQDGSFTATTVPTTFTGPVNEAVQIYGNADLDATAADFAGGASATTITGSTNISFNATTKTITTADPHGFEINEVIKVTGTTNNNGYYVISSVPSLTTFVVEQAIITENGTSATILGVGYDLKGIFKIYVRTRGKTYANADLTTIGVDSMTYIVYRFPVANSPDLNIATTSDNAFTGAAISTLSGNGTTTTVATSVVHGLYAGAPITISGTGEFTAGNYVVDSVTDASTFTLLSTFNGTETVGGGELVKLRYVDTMTISYLPNPDSLSGDVVIKGNWTVGVQYNLGDVVFDNGNSRSDANGARWYYLDATTGVTTGANMSEDTTDNTWVLWNDGQRDIEENGTWSAYTVVYDLNSGGTTPGATKEIAYEYAQYQLRLNSNINDNANSTQRNGNLADSLVYFIGSQLHTYADPTQPEIPFAVVLDDIAGSDANSVTYHDWENELHFAPIVVTVTITFNDNLFNDANSVFYAYYSTSTGGNFGTSGALQLKQSNGNDVGSEISNLVPDNGVYEFIYAYTSDTTNGRTGGTPVDVTVVSIGLDRGQYVLTTGTITSAGANIPLVAPLERNYTDPNN